jgi:hypothetical protein
MYVAIGVGVAFTALGSTCFFEAPQVVLVYWEAFAV